MIVKKSLICNKWLLNLKLSFNPEVEMKFTNHLKVLMLGLALSVLAPSLVQAEEAPNSSLIDTADFEQLLDLNLFEDTTAQSKQAKRNRRIRQKRTEVCNSWVPYIMKNHYFEPSKGYFFRIDSGLGLLYFSGINQDLQITALQGTGQTTTRVRNRSLQGQINYNKTPVYEATLGTKLGSWISLGLSLVHQGGVYVETPLQFYGNPTGTVGNFNVLAGPSAYRFRSCVAFNAIMAKLYFNWPSSLIWKKIAYNFYFGGGGGAGWQTWAMNTVLIQSPTGVTYNGSGQLFYALKQKFSSNFVWMGDVGVKLRSLIPDVGLGARVGVKLIGWGQARQIGLPSQQKNVANFGLMQPFSVKLVYSIAPYLGVQWDF